MGKVLSCGFVLTYRGNILLGHVTGQKYWDIPKGCLEKGESFFDTAKRELYEETGIVLPSMLDSSEFKELGYYRYTRKKDLYLFWYHPGKLIALDSMLQQKEGRLEFDEYRYVQMSCISLYVTESMRAVLRSVFSTISEKIV